MSERFESPANNYDRELLLKELATTLESKTRDALDGVDDVEKISFRVNYHQDEIDGYKDDVTFEEREDLIVGEAVALYTETLPIVRQRLMEWFGVVEEQRNESIDQETGHFIVVISEAYKPEGWNTWLYMPTTFTLKFTTSFDKWLQDQPTAQ